MPTAEDEKYRDIVIRVDTHMQTVLDELKGLRVDVDSLKLSRAENKGRERTVNGVISVLVAASTSLVAKFWH